MSQIGSFTRSNDGVYSGTIKTLAIDAKAICTRVLELDPYHEAACRELMRIYAAEGQVWEAVRVFDRCRQLLHEDLGVGPEPETAELMARIRGGKPAMPAPGSGLILPAQPRVTLAERPPGEALVQPLAILRTHQVAVIGVMAAGTRRQRRRAAEQRKGAAQRFRSGEPDDADARFTRRRGDGGDGIRSHTRL